MKLVRFGAAGREKPGIIDAKGSIRDLSKVVTDIAGDALSPKGLAKIRKANDRQAAAGEAAIRGSAPASASVGNFIAIGLNYADHAAEAGMPIPKEPIIFNKAPSCICGPNDDTIIPKDSTKLDWEVELGIVIGSARAISRRTRRSTRSPAIAWPTTCPSACSRSSAPANGPRARAARRSARSAPGSSPRTRSRTRRTSTCGSTSTARSASAATPRP